MSNDPSRRSFLAAGLAVPALDPLNQGQRTPSSRPAVRYRTLGKTGLKVTELGFGCEAVSDISVFQAALDQGINFFDTARAYEGGNNEVLLGKALGTRRKQVILTSRSYGNDAKAIAADLDTSLKALGTDYLDVWYIGNKDNPAMVKDDMLEVQVRAQKAGKIRFKGLSTHRLHEMLSFATAPGRFDVLLTSYNFTMGSKFDGPLEAMNKAGLGVVAIKVMAGGHPKPCLPALKWALRNSWIHTTAVGMRDREALAENMRVMSETFTEQDRKLLASQLPAIGAVVCRMCGKCDGTCPRGLPVSDLVRFVMYAEGYRDYYKGRSRFEMLSEEVRAVRCEDCTSCPVRCPNGVRVRERATRAQELFA